MSDFCDSLEDPSRCDYAQNRLVGCNFTECESYIVTRHTASVVTDDYRPDNQTDVSQQVRVAIVGASQSPIVDELYPLLLRRLRTYSLIATFGIGAYICLVMLNREIALRIGLPELEEFFREPAVVGLRIAAFAASAIVAFVLLNRPPLTVPSLRLTELVVVAVLASCLIANGILGYHLLLAKGLLHRGTFLGLYVLNSTLLWFSVIVWYGALIPNTRRRCATIVGILALSPLLVFAIQAFVLQPLPLVMAVWAMTQQTLWISIAAAIAVFSASRIESLRRQAAEARRLGQYVLGDQLGGGGMGQVYRAEHILLRRPCALKVIRPERTGDPKNLLRFEREVRVTATLTHPNTVQIYDYGRAQDGTFYYVMEYLPGQDLKQMVEENGPLSPDRAVHLLRQVCGALSEAHVVGLIHRDIKPSNIIVCERGGVPDVAKLLDFGLADAAEPQPGGDLTAQGQVLGTPAYMSPEQAAGTADVDARSDLYSLGATAYFLLTGNPPFERTTPMLIITAHIHDPVTPPRDLRTEIPEDLSAVIVRCLEKDPSRRYQDATALESALADCRCAGNRTEKRASQIDEEPAFDGQNPVGTSTLEGHWGM